MDFVTGQFGDGGGSRFGVFGRLGWLARFLGFLRRLGCFRWLGRFNGLRYCGRLRFVAVRVAFMELAARVEINAVVVDQDIRVAVVLLIGLVIFKHHLFVCAWRKQFFL